VLILIELLAALLASGILYQAIGAWRDKKRYPPPGTLLDVGGNRLHAYITGQGEPVVVLEAGIAATSLSWQLVQPEIANFTRVLSYDRAGLGWSDPASGPSTIETALSGLRALLNKAGLPGPYVLAGHSFGGLAAIEYACRYPKEIAGLVLIDPLTAVEWCPAAPEELAKLRRGVKFARRGALLASFGVVRLSLDLLRSGARRIPQMAARVSSSQGGSKLTERLVGEIRKLPPGLWPAIQSHWCQPKSFLSMASHLESLPVSAASCTMIHDLGDLPLTILTASDASPQRAAEHLRIAAASTRGTRICADRSGHWIQLDEPQLVVEAVRSVIIQIKST
jgi:pimeloyl-ACP methyl ester carboxylesterase